MAMPFLPKDEIEPMFNTLRAQVSSDQLKQFVEYISETWIHGEFWPLASWTCYKQAVRTNNDIEGWHNALNRRAAGKSQLPFYLMINLLDREAQLALLHIKLVSEKKMRRVQRRNYRTMQARIHKYWSEFEEGKITATKLLKRCSYLNGPIRK